MLITVTGGSGSGKSAYAEKRAGILEPEDKVYIATMEPYDEESFRRIDRHRRMRAGSHYRTIECYRHLEQVNPGEKATVLLECMSNLVANEMFSPEGRGHESAPAVLEGLRHLASSCRNLVVVTNNVFDAGHAAEESSEEYLGMLGQINRGLAEMSDEMIDVICGVPVPLKQPAPEYGREGVPSGGDSGMILITGGAYQGAEHWAQELAAREYAGSSEKPVTADGRTASDEEMRSARILCYFQEWIRRVMQRGGDIDAELDLLLKAGTDRIIATQELGCGLVPVDAFERQYREKNGRISCRLAEMSDAVYRVTCGIPQKIR